MAEPKVREDLKWAQEVMLVYDNNEEALTTSSAKRLFRWAREDDKNEMKFLADMVPKAAAIIEKNAPKDMADAVREIDVKTIGELQEFLGAAVKEATKS